MNYYAMLFFFNLGETGVHIGACIRWLFLQYLFSKLIFAKFKIAKMSIFTSR